jgi:hypothetical protein
MIVISHRGNLEGKNVEVENTPKQIDLVLSKGIQVEIDIRWSVGKWYVGHDYGSHIVSDQYLLDRKEMLWCHAKNIAALERMLGIGLHCFWHQDDYYTLTSKGIVWAYPNYYADKGVLVMPDKDFLDSITNPIYGICVDNPVNFI